MVKKISVVIPFIHEYPSLYATVNNVQTELVDSAYDWEIVVAENGTVDRNTPHMKKLYRYILRRGRLKYVFSPHQCGPVARNTGARLADGDFLIFMDAHTTLGKDSIAPLADYLTDHEECGSVAGLTAWSHYQFQRLGAFYGLFHPRKKQEEGRGGPSLPTHMHGHYKAMGHLRDKTLLSNPRPFEIVAGSQAYTMYRRDEFFDWDGYFDECRFYPHPEGHCHLKVRMMGKTVVTHPWSYHIHGMYPRSYKFSNATKILDGIAGVLRSELEDSEKLRAIKQEMTYDDPDEGQRKMAEYGGWSWHEHGIRNVFMVAYILGDEKWLDICQKYISRKHGRKFEELRRSAVETVDATGQRERLRNRQQMSLDEVLTKARKDRIPGMENWFAFIGKDPLK